jgi:hypothetical protein
MARMLKRDHRVKEVAGRIGAVTYDLCRDDCLAWIMGGGSTIAAAIAVGYQSIGVETDRRFFMMAEQAIPRLAAPPDRHDRRMARPRLILRHDTPRMAKRSD